MGLTKAGMTALGVGALAGLSGYMQARKKRQAQSQGSATSATSAGSDASSSAPDMSDVPISMRKGGKVRKTGLYRLHKNEYVVPARKSRGRRAGRGRR